jgi:antitoxin (DNA-binding transcriptional repressor) of toxin-antitoxin stability system
MIFMPEVSATHVARHFADILDGVEHRGERYTIVRRGKAIARLEPIPDAGGSSIKRLLSDVRPDEGWAEDLEKVRDLVELDR